MISTAKRIGASAMTVTQVTPSWPNAASSFSNAREESLRWQAGWSVSASSSLRPRSGAISSEQNVTSWKRLADTSARETRMSTLAQVKAADEKMREAHRALLNYSNGRSHPSGGASKISQSPERRNRPTTFGSCLHWLRSRPRQDARSVPPGAAVGGTARPRPCVGTEVAWHRDFPVCAHHLVHGTLRGVQCSDQVAAAEGQRRLLCRRMTFFASHARSCSQRRSLYPTTSILRSIVHIVEVTTWSRDAGLLSTLHTRRRHSRRRALDDPGDPSG
jgi:hypothetical protein